MRGRRWHVTVGAGLLLTFAASGCQFEVTTGEEAEEQMEEMQERADDSG